MVPEFTELIRGTPTNAIHLQEMKQLRVGGGSRATDRIGDCCASFLVEAIKSYRCERATNGKFRLVQVPEAQLHRFDPRSKFQVRQTITRSTTHRIIGTYCVYRLCIYASWRINEPFKEVPKMDDSSQLPLKRLNSIAYPASFTSSLVRKWETACHVERIVGLIRITSKDTLIIRLKITAW